MEKPYYMNFQFLRFVPDYHLLLPNEKVVAKQDFISAYDTMQNRMPLASYALTGLVPDADILIWRVSQRLEDLHAMSCRLQYSGLGKYLIPARSYLGTVSGERYQGPAQQKGGAEPPPILGLAPYLILQPVFTPVRETLEKSDAVSTHHIHIADASGIDAPDHIIAFETDNPAHFREFAKSHNIPLNTTTHTCILASMKEIVDSFG